MIKMKLAPRLLFIAAAVAMLASCSAPVQAETADEIATSYKAEIVRVLDGDTVEVKIELLPELFQVIHVREGNLDTPEKRRGRFGAQCEQELEFGKLVSQYVMDLLPIGTVVQIENVRLGKYAGRTIGDIKLTLEPDGPLVDLGDHLISQGMAVSYDGGTKNKVWCDASADP
jgi:micrococcal nuclease